jgi:hypothetical protein
MTLWRLSTVAVVIVVSLFSSLTLASASASTGGHLGGYQERAVAHAGTSLHLRQPSGLAIAPDGVLFIADEALNEVLARSPSGQLLVIAGTGRAGFSGDGGSSTRAELDEPSYLARSPDGTLYVAVTDRVRAIFPDGRIETVAGDGGTSPSGYSVGTLAIKVGVQPGGLAVGSKGALFVATGNDVLEISSSGVIVRVINLIKTPGVTLKYAVCDPQGITIDAVGNLAIGCSNSRQLIERLSSGMFTMVAANYRPHDFAGMAFLPGGALLFANGESLFGEVGGTSTIIMNYQSFGKKDVFVPSGIAVAANGTIYSDSGSGDGFSSGAALAKVTPAGQPILLRLWKEQ